MIAPSPFRTGSVRALRLGMGDYGGVLMGFTITDEWLVRYSTNGRGAWKANQLRLIGVKLPPRKGWKQQVIGKVIDEQQRKRFEEIGEAAQASLFSQQSPEMDSHLRSIGGK